MAPTTMLAAVSKPGNDNLVLDSNYPVTAPKAGQVLLKVSACGGKTRLYTRHIFPLIQVLIMYLIMLKYTKRTTLLNNTTRNTPVLFHPTDRDMKKYHFTTRSNSEKKEDITGTALKSEPTGETCKKE
ncbi:hypothetical protein C8J56DRAFT_903095 [Mycena floridula]|nr:hypothetical protein C8J56DRAFT_903095 [Mycena floridula]